MDVGHRIRNAPTGHCIPAQGNALGPEDPTSRVLKERRIFRDRRPRLFRCGVPSERIVFASYSQGCTLGWYATPRWGMNSPATSPCHGSFSNILIHLIWSTRDRHPWLEPCIRDKTHAFLAGAVRQCDCEAYQVGGPADHVHLAIRLARTTSVADLVKETKAASSKWLKTQGPQFNRFSWQLGYGAFSIGISQKESLIVYINNQEEHHRTRSFQDEYRDFLKKYGIACDERYVWD